MSIGDLNAGARGGAIGERACARRAARYGAELVQETFEAILDHGESIARAELRRDPAGVYEADGVIDGDGVSARSDPDQGRGDGGDDSCSPTSRGARRRRGDR